MYETYTKNSLIFFFAYNGRYCNVCYCSVLTYFALKIYDPRYEIYLRYFLNWVYSVW